MKKFIKKLKGKKVLSIVLAAVMLATTFNIALPMLKLDAGAVTIGGITQERVVGTDGSYATTYANYASQFLNGCSEPTDIVIPGLNHTNDDASTSYQDNDFVIQGLAYYEPKDWIMISMYHNDGTAPSMLFAVSAKTGIFEAAFAIANSVAEDGTITYNYDHGGGLAFSEYNFYYSGDDTDKDDDGVADADCIAYASLEQFNNPQDRDGDDIYEVVLEGRKQLPEMGGTATAYVCYDEGILWAGNFYAEAVNLYVTKLNSDYDSPINDTYESAVFGYRLAGSSSEEEWNYLCGKYRNLLNVSTTSGAIGDGTWSAYKNADSMTIYGDIPAPVAYVGEYTYNGVAKFNLTEGSNYTIEFTASNNESDLYMWSPGGKHCNVKQSSQTTITQLPDGRYHYKMNFTAGLKPNGADSGWPTTQSTDGSFTGEYTLRFDQDNIAAGEARSFEIANIRVYETPISEELDENYEGGRIGNPSHILTIDESVAFNIQYAIVEKGRLYLSRSYGVGDTDGLGSFVSGTIAGLSDYSTLSIYDIDLSIPGTTPFTYTDDTGTSVTVNTAYNISGGQNFEFMPMSEGLCFINDNLYMTFESATNKYMNEGQDYVVATLTCKSPIDVIWKIDTYALTGQQRPRQVQTDYYQKVNSLSEIESDEEYLIVYESDEIDPITQQNTLYALDADGSFKDYRLSKSNKGYDGLVCHPITAYDIVDDILYIDNPEVDDVENLRWEIRKNTSGYNIKNTELHFTKFPNLYIGQTNIGMVTDEMSLGGNIQILESGNGKGGFWLSDSTGQYFLWCNDSLSNNYTPKINKYYARNGSSVARYSGLSEKAGTVHCNALYTGSNNIISGAVETGASEYYSDGVFYIYKRIYDPCSETEQSRVFTDLTARVESDGTYTVDMETYAISSTHYKILSEKPTDYIFVLDASGSMTNNSDAKGYYTDSGWKDMSVETAGGTDSTKDPGSVQINGYEYHADAYYKTDDGVYHPIYVAVNTYDRGSSAIFRKIYQNFWCYYRNKTDGLCYMMYPDVRSGAVATGMGGSVASTGITFADLQAKVQANTDVCASSSHYNASTRDDEIVYNGPHYKIKDVTRLEAMKQSLVPFVDKIAEKATASGLDHRISLVTFGSTAAESYLNTGMYPNTGTTFTGYTSLGITQYKNAFYNVGSFGNVKTAIESITTNIDDPDTYSNHGMEIANNIVTNTVGKDGSAQNYLTTGDRNLCVIMITDGIPGTGNDATEATNVANGAISQAKALKDKGAAIFTLQIGSNSLSGFDMNAYLNYVSSEYESATSMTSPGSNNIKDIVYRLDVPTATFDLNTLTKDVFDQITTNVKTDLAQLNNNSIIQQKLSDVFDASNATLSAKVQKGYYDAVGRLTFEDTTSDTQITSSISSNVVTATGFNYAEKYITKEKTGEKLIVSVKGLLPKKGVDFHNTSINDQSETGLYQDATALANDEYFKRFPAEFFSVPEYTYVLDYGLTLLDTDVNGTLCSVSDTLSKQSTYNKSTLDGDLAIQNGDQNLLYSISPDAFTAEEVTNGTAERSGYTLINRPDGTYDWFKIKVVPASNIYYEETTFDVTNGSNPDWTAETNGTVADYRGLPEEGDVDGFDNAYDNNNKYSNGTILSTAVDKSNKRSDTASVTFTGNGFDLVSACGPNTGVQLVAIKQGGKTIKSYIVDTYYKGELASEDGSLVSQVPIVNWRTDTFGEYTVETKGYYLSNAGALRTSGIKNNLIDTGLVKNSADLEASIDVEKILADEGMASEDVEVIWFDDNSILNGGTGAKATKKAARDGSTVTSLKTYVDGFRIYNPLGTDSSDYADGEKNASYVNVIENLAPVNEVINGIGFISGTLEEGVNLSFSNYETVGPQGEFYLKANQAITFKVKVNPGDKVMLGLRAVNGATTINVNNVKNIAINSATEMFYDISNCIGAVTSDNTEVQITVQNGAGILALNQVKFSGGAKVNTNNPAVRSLARSGEATQEYSNIFLPLTAEDLTEVENTFAAKEAVDGIVKNGVVIPLVEEENENTDDNTTPDVPSDDTNNDDTNTDSGEKEEFSIFSLLELLISLIEKILHSAFGTGNLF